MPKGIPHSVFLGRAIRSGEPQWSDDDQDKALAFIREQAKVCSSCQSRRDLWSKADPKDPPYMGQQDVCPGCQLLEQERRNIREGTEGFTRPYLELTEFARPPDEED